MTTIINGYTIIRQCCHQNTFDISFLTFDDWFFTPFIVAESANFILLISKALFHLPHWRWSADQTPIGNQSVCFLPNHVILYYWLLFWVFRDEWISVFKQSKYIENVVNKTTGKTSLHGKLNKNKDHRIFLRIFLCTKVYSIHTIYQRKRIWYGR